MRFWFNIYLVCIALLLGATQTFAQEGISPYEQIADLFHQRAGAYSCEFASNAIKRIKSQSEVQIKETIVASLEKLDVKLESDNLKIRDKIIAGLESICRFTRVPVQKMTHSLALSNAVLVNSAALSIGVPIDLIKATVTNKKTIKREDFIYHVMGPHNGKGPFLLGLLLFQSPDLLLGFNPAFALINGSIAVELITNYECRFVNLLNKEKVEFCQTYQDLKEFFHRGREKSFALGLKLKGYLNKRAQIKQNELGASGFCSLERSKQVELARKTLERNDYLKIDERIKSAEVLLPIHKNSCTKILIQADEDDLEELGREYKQIDSISIVLLKNGEYPENYYFSQLELDQLSLQQQLCHDVERNYFGQFVQNEEELIEDFFKVSLAPSLLSQPETEKIILKDDQVYQGELSNLRNVILSLGPIDSKNEELKLLKLERKKIIKEIKRNYKKIMRSKNLKNCLQVIKDRDIEIPSFTKSIQRLNEIHNHSLIKRQEELDVIRKIMKRARFKLKLDWELLETNELNEVIQILKRSDIGNVIIIGHGKSSGHFVDSANQEFPREAFAEISPTIMSLNLYSCHSKTLIDLYQLKQKMSQGNSIYKIRYLTNVAQNDFLESENYAPLTAFGDYLSRIDRYLERSLKGASLLQENFHSQLRALPLKKVCHADISDLKVMKGSYGIVLNDNLIGVTSVNKAASTLEFSCDFLRSGLNTLKIKNVFNEGGSDFDFNDFKIVIENAELTDENATLKKSSLTILKFNF